MHVPCVHVCPVHTDTCRDQRRWYRWVLAPLQEQKIFLTIEPSSIPTPFQNYWFRKGRSPYVAMATWSYVDQGGLKFTKFCRPLPPQCWAQRFIPSYLAPKYSPEASPEVQAWRVRWGRGHSLCSPPGQTGCELSGGSSETNSF